MSKSRDRVARTQRTNEEATALIASEKAERERKTAKLRELRLSQQREAVSPRESAPKQRAPTTTPSALDLMKTVKAKMRKS